MGNAVKMAAADAKQQILQLAAKSLQANDLVIKEGKVFSSRAPDNALTIAQVLSSNFGSSGTVLGRGYYIPQTSEGAGAYFSVEMIFWLLGAHGVELEVNRETGQVKILKLYAARRASQLIPDMQGADSAAPRSEWRSA
jgi:CO/xanthine dehydrogenase Mo-binding subunit